MGCDELVWRAHAELGVRVVDVVVFEPGADRREGREGVGDGSDAHVVALEGVDERLRDAVALRATLYA